MAGDYSALTGRWLGNYLLQGLLKRGGMAEVYRGQEIDTNRTVAVKVLSPALAADPEYVASFKNEVAQVRRLAHPNIVPIESFGEQGQYFYLVMPLYRASLRDVLNTQWRIDPLDALEVAIQIASALTAVHRLGLIHRDVKPGNILLSENQAFLTDFGIVRQIEFKNTGQAPTLAGTGLPIGTPQYMAPEQLSGQPVDYRADLYSLGAVLYEMLTGQPPHVADTPYAVAARALNDSIAPPSSINPAIWPELDAAVMRALARNPNDRYANADDMREALAQVKNHSQGATTNATSSVKSAGPSSSGSGIGPGLVGGAGAGGVGAGSASGVRAGGVGSSPLDAGNASGGSPSPFAAFGAPSSGIRPVSGGGSAGASGSGARPVGGSTGRGANGVGGASGITAGMAAGSNEVTFRDSSGVLFPPLPPSAPTSPPPPTPPSWPPTARGGSGSGSNDRRKGLQPALLVTLALVLLSIALFCGLGLVINNGARNSGGNGNLGAGGQNTPTLSSDATYNAMAATATNYALTPTVTTGPGTPTPTPRPPLPTRTATPRPPTVTVGPGTPTPTPYPTDTPVPTATDTPTPEPTATDTPTPTPTDTPTDVPTDTPGSGD